MVDASIGSGKLVQPTRGGALLGAVLVLPGCGIILTRGESAYHYPGKSVVEDFRLMFKRSTGATASGLRYWEAQGARIHAGAFILSLPIDLALDTLLLPLDVGVGIYRLFSENPKPTSAAPPPGKT
jgi:uncharacterized protein YceK